MTPSALWNGVRGLRHRPVSRTQIVDYQLGRLRAVVDHAYRRVPYYRRLLDEAGFRPGNLRSLDDLAQLPITRREDLQFLPPDQICASNVGPESLVLHATSGSTGAPLTVRRDANEERLLLAFRVRALGPYGLGLRARRVQIDHFSPEALALEGRPALHERFGILPRLLIEWRTPKEEMFAALDEFRPDIISGPPSVLSWLAADLTEADRRRLTASLVVTGAETHLPEMRRAIEQGFGLPVADVYGSHEVVFIGSQRPDEPGYRICEEATLVEVVREDGRAAEPGETGEVVVTALHSYAMPFIRYRLGDQVVVGEPSGPYRTLRSIDGRIIDRFRLPSGRWVHGYTLGQLAKTPGLEVRQFQIVQERRDSFRMRLAVRGSADHDLQPIREALIERLEPGVEVLVEAVDEIPPHPSGKFYPFVSLERLKAWQSR